MRPEPNQPPATTLDQQSNGEIGMRSKSALFLFSLTTTLATLVVAQQDGALDIREFVKSDSFMSSYRELSSEYGELVTGELIDMLRSPSDAPYWSRVVILLSEKGDERASRALIEFIETPYTEERITFDIEVGRKAAITSLGVVVNRLGDDDALQYLLDSLSPSIWRQRELQGIASWSSSVRQYDSDLSTAALFGVALSGHPRAGVALRTLQQTNPQDDSLRRELGDETINQWVEVYDLVRERGIDGMYEYYDEKRRAAGIHAN